MNDCLQCKTIAKENNEKAMESEITRLREQVAALENSLAEHQQDAQTTADALGHVQQQLEEVNADRDEWIACHAKIFRELQETKTLVGNKCAEVAALAEQNEKLRTALESVIVSDTKSTHGTIAVWRVREALSLPDIATPAINRIRAEGMRMAAEICDDYSEKKWHAYKGIDGAAADLACDIEQGESSGAEDCANAIRARADELYPEVKL